MKEFCVREKASALASAPQGKPCKPCIQIVGMSSVRQEQFLDLKSSVVSPRLHFYRLPDMLPIS